MAGRHCASSACHTRPPGSSRASTALATRGPLGPLSGALSSSPEQDPGSASGQ
eukprot:CAMPEP_0119084020 /NCGR_PEP_ID=MMETSP1178-20130426/127897_1 /TAXON_ID=33656 /ORGANISM="unid sp, Strain CCMP2000" /LENGTH=52 /DNA_ID=CAMNT_0007066947 /DNA_START=554 /DNA_END=712 /DNA_ORIENTATION=+